MTVVIGKRKRRILRIRGKRLGLMLVILCAAVVLNTMFFSTAIAAAGEPTRAGAATLTVTVQPGDTLWELAGRYGSSSRDTGWTVYEIERLNATGPLIRPGQELIIPLY